MQKAWFRWIVSLLVMALWGPTLLAAQTPSKDTIVILKASIPGIFDVQKPGPYNHLFDTVMEKVGTPVSHRWGQVPKAMFDLYMKDVDCIFISSLSTDYFEKWGFAKEQILASDPVNDIAVRVYAAPGVTPPKDLRGFVGRLAVGDHTTIDSLRVRGALPRGLNIVETEGYREAFDLLDQGRVDFVIAFDFDASLYFDSVGVEYPTNPEIILVELQDAVSCVKSPKVEAFLVDLNAVIADLRKSGQLQKLLSVKEK